MNKLFAISLSLAVLSGCTAVNPYRPMSAAAEVQSSTVKNIVDGWAKVVPGGQVYESRRFDYINGYPSVQWSAGSWVGKPPPYGFGNSLGGWSYPLYPMYPRY